MGTLKADLINSHLVRTVETEVRTQLTEKSQETLKLPCCSAPNTHLQRPHSSDEASDHKRESLLYFMTEGEAHDKRPSPRGKLEAPPQILWPCSIPPKIFSTSVLNLPLVPLPGPLDRCWLDYLPNFHIWLRGEKSHPTPRLPDPYHFDCALTSL